MPDIPHRLFEDCGSEIVYSVKKSEQRPIPKERRFSDIEVCFAGYQYKG